MPSEYDPATGTLKIREHPALSRIALGVYAAATTNKESYQCRTARRRQRTRMVINYDKTDAARLTVPEGIGEMFGYRLAESAGVRVPVVTLTADEPEDFTRHHVKRIPGGWMLSERVPNSIPVYYLSHFVETSAISGEPEYAFRAMFRESFDKRCPIERQAYSDFPANVPQAARDAARWDSPQRLNHYAYRALLGCTYPHSSNCLVTTSGELWLIDHEKMCVDTEGDDLALLFSVICDSEAALGVCRRVAAGITTETIERALADIPARFWRGMKRYARYDNEQSAAQYFTNRLTRWNELFGEREAARHAG